MSDSWDAITARRASEAPAAAASSDAWDAITTRKADEAKRIPKPVIVGLAVLALAFFVMATKGKR